MCSVSPFIWAYSMDLSPLGSRGRAGGRAVGRDGRRAVRKMGSCAQAGGRSGEHVGAREGGLWSGTRHSSSGVVCLGGG